MGENTSQLDGRRVLVVGASSGIGQGVACSLSAAGAHVALAARRLDRLEQTAGECPGPAVCLRCDVTEPGAPAAAVAEAVGALGGLDAVVYAPGTTAFATIEQATAEDWSTTLATNVVGAALLLGAAVPHLRETSGHAVYVSSVSARFYSPWKGLGLYVASKRRGVGAGVAAAGGARGRVHDAGGRTHGLRVRPRPRRHHGRVRSAVVRDRPDRRHHARTVRPRPGGGEPPGHGPSGAGVRDGDRAPSQLTPLAPVPGG